MALLFIDSFDSYAVSTDLLLNGWTNVSTANPVPVWSATLGRFGAGALTIINSDSDSRYARANAFAYSAGYTLNVAFWFYQTAVPSLYTAAKAGVISVDTFVMLSPDSMGRFSFLPYGSNVRNGNVSGFVCDARWHWVEFQVVFATTAVGSFAVYVDGTLAASATNIVTVTVGTPAGQLTIGSGGNNGGITATNYYDDLIVWDNTGTSADLKAFPIGPQQLYCKQPNSVGDSTQFTASAGANYAVASQAWSAAATLTDTGTGTLDLYNVSNTIPDTHGITGVVQTIYAENLGPGTRTVIPKIKSGGTVASGATQTLTAGPVSRRSLSLLDPSGAAWTPTTVNAMQIGMGD